MLIEAPRKLPAKGTVEVWIDTGSSAGFTREISVDHLFLAEEDDGQGSRAVYRVVTRECDG